MLYVGSVHVGLKDAIFEHSTPRRHACELYSILRSASFSKQILFIYSDGGPDHRLTYMSVKLSLICLFLKLDLDYLCAGRTAPYHSWKNPVERIMSLLNLGLQCVGLAREKMGDGFEHEVAKCNSVSELRKALESHQEVVQESLSPVKSLLCKLFSRLKLHDETIKMFSSATTDELSEFWTAIMAIDDTLTEHGVYRQETMSKHQKIMEFMTHCCQASHYTFDILKCGIDSCTICSPVRLPPEVFNTLRHFPHPTPGNDDDHYLPFSQVFGTITSEEYRPSYKRRAASESKRVKRKLSFYASVQHVRNSQLMIQCMECNQWRLIFSKYKLKKEQKVFLQSVIDNYMYSCGASLKDLELPEEYSTVDIRDHDCYDPVEKLYYSAKNDPICMYCAVDQPYTSNEHYPLCSDCESLGKVAIPKRK